MTYGKNWKPVTQSYNVLSCNLKRTNNVRYKIFLKNAFHIRKTMQKAISFGLNRVSLWLEASFSFFSCSLMILLHEVFIDPKVSFYNQIEKWHGMLLFQLEKILEFENTLRI